MVEMCQLQQKYSWREHMVGYYPPSPARLILRPGVSTRLCLSLPKGGRSTEMCYTGLGGMAIRETQQD